jgi:hypothetical protein
MFGQQQIGTPVMGMTATNPMGVAASPMGMGATTMGMNPMGATTMGMNPMGATTMGMNPMGASPMGMGATTMGMNPMGASPMGMGATTMGMNPMGATMGMNPMGAPMGMGMSMGYSKGLISDLFSMSKLKTSYNYGNRKSLKILIIIGTIFLLINSLLWSFLPYDNFCSFLEKIGMKNCMDKKILIAIALISLALFDVMFYTYFRNPIYSRRFLIMMLILNVLIITASYVVNVFLYGEDQSKLK